MNKLYSILICLTFFMSISYSSANQTIEEYENMDVESLRNILKIQSNHLDYLSELKKI